jgi:hypothetical protein
MGARSSFRRPDRGASAVALVVAGQIHERDRSLGAEVLEVVLVQLELHLLTARIVEAQGAHVEAKVARPDADIATRPHFRDRVGTADFLAFGGSREAERESRLLFERIAVAASRAAAKQSKANEHARTVEAKTDREHGNTPWGVEFTNESGATTATRCRRGPGDCSALKVESEFVPTTRRPYSPSGAHGRVGAACKSAAETRQVRPGHPHSVDRDLHHGPTRGPAGPVPRRPPGLPRSRRP